jgi:hypothetical protein
VITQDSASPGHRLLRELMDRAVCLHDDWNHILGEGDWDQFDTNPMLLGAKRCVMHELLGFGDSYLEYLNELDCCPDEIISPVRRSKSVSHDLLADDLALARVKAALAVSGSCLSTYYSYENMNLQAILALPGGFAACVPPIEVFNKIISRVGSHDVFRKAGVPTPLGEVCRDRQDVVSFFAAARRAGYRSIIVKEHHRKMIAIDDDLGLQTAVDDLQYPVVAEVIHEVCSSPVVQSIRIADRTEGLFALKQRISRFHFDGNESPHALGSGQVATMWRYNRQIADALPGYQGVFGVDYVVTPEHQIYAVDLNPRFNSSTYPYFFLERMGLDVNSCYSRYGFIESCHLPKTRSGVFIYNPVFSSELGKVRKWSYIVVAGDAESLAILQLKLDACLSRIGHC